MPFPLYLNELSLSIQEQTQQEKLQLVLGLIDTLRAVKQKRPDVELHNSLPLYECDMGGGNYLCTILVNGNHNDQWRFIKTVVQRAPWDIGSVKAQVVLNGLPSVGVSLALEKRSATISLASERVWSDGEIHITVSGQEIVIPNLSAPSHADHWDLWLREFGIDVSTSSIVFNGDFVIRLYQQDHNPPHVHVESGEYKAKIDIRNLDTLAGRLPPHISSLVVAWIEKNRAILLESWERCRNDLHPITIGN